MLKKLALISAVSTLAIGAALAQSPSPPAAQPSPPAATESAPKADIAPKADLKADTTGTTGGAQFVSSQKPEQFLASRFKGTDVFGADNEKIGDITDILFDKDGKIEAFVVSVGGFLGMGAKDVAMAPNAFKFEKDQSTWSHKAKVSMTKDQLKQAANFEPYREPRATTGAGGGVGGGAPRPGGMGGGVGGGTR